jgi:3-phosphoglycerate kinase
MFLPKITEADLKDKRVLLRADLDVDQPNDKDQRLIVTSQTVKFLLEKGAKVIILGHKGRPEGKVDNKFSLKSVSEVLSKLIGHEIKFIYDIAGAEAHEEAGKLQNGEVMMVENLRFDSREEGNDESFAKSLSELGEMYVNEAFASSHRKHASITGIPKFLPHAAGIRFESEIKNLSLVFENPKRPLLFIISGLKEDKLTYVKSFESLADKILIGGRLPELLGDKALESVRLQNGKVITGNLVMDKEDITLNTIEVFEKEIVKAGTIVVSGPLGKFEEDGHRQGTERVYKAVAASAAYKIAGGGDTEAALNLFNLTEKFDWVSVGGGAMLEFLSQKTLPGIEALINENGEK